MRIVVLGAGLVGHAIVRDLAAEPRFAVTAVDASPDALRRLSGVERVTTAKSNLTARGAAAAAVRGADLAICAVPGRMGFETLRGVIEAGVDVVDISFFPEDPFALDELARRHGVTAVVDCGVAPGLCNVMAGRLDDELDRLTRYACYVGGLPTHPVWPFGYRSVFSPADVIEEYVRPARMVERGRETVRDALTDVELIEFPGVGVLEAFNTDGLRTLARTLDAPEMKEKTLRWPGHAELMRAFRETGLFSREPVRVAEVAIAPLEVTSALLFEAWRMSEGEQDFTAMRVEIDGVRGGVVECHTFDLLDRFDDATSTTSMARTTGFTATLVARMVAEGRFSRPGISPPEFVGRTPGCWEVLMAGYAERGIELAHQVRPAA